MQPLTLGRLLDNSFKITLAVTKKILLPIYIPLAVINGLFPAFFSPKMYNGDKLMIVIMVLAAIILGLIALCLSFASYIWIGQIISEHWKGNSDITVGQVLKQAYFRKLGSLMFVSTIVGLGVAAGPMIGGIVGSILAAVLAAATKGSWGLLLFAPCVCLGFIPSFIFYLNRILAPFIVIIEGQKGSQALDTSKSLMNRTPRGQKGSPFRRLAAVSVCIWVITIAIAMSTTWILQPLSGSDTILYLFISQSLSYLINAVIGTIATATYIGFYQDLLARYEATDILSNLATFKKQAGSPRPPNRFDHQQPLPF